MLELMGSEYVIDHCICAMRAMRIEEEFRYYVTDSLMYINESVANALGGTYLQGRFADMFKEKAEDDRTGDEIALEVIKRAGLKTRQE